MFTQLLIAQANAASSMSFSQWLLLGVTVVGGVGLIFLILKMKPAA
ncbi:hypothetical protein ETAA8_15120 [Anatilimnocola aggregata]|uniref:Uncharacterized protein n=1 Tax=Anatilimnocola aggregata TaxID=2528021 RepID=A0A517Y860_9BACT|nr:hypothetical protein [Anatilimnocola aggregata]QDU26434.1 hypothetical protein ETAA8_15120 [Anatilimnocola aggregata]